MNDPASHGAGQRDAVEGARDLEKSNADRQAGKDG